MKQAADAARPKICFIGMRVTSYLEAAHHSAAVLCKLCINMRALYALKCRLASVKQAAYAAGRKICFIGLILYLEAAHHSAAELYTSIHLRVM